MGKKITKDELATIITDLSRNGIQADRNHLIEDIGAQFADHREWVREYVVNAFDAGATWCKISGRQENDIITIFVDDNGHGMDEQGVKDFMTLFKSVKKGDPGRAIGRFGVGKASIIAIPNLVGMGMQTSTGVESWQLEAGSIVDDTPVTMKQFAPPLPQGTRFAVSYKVSKANMLGRELRQLRDVLWKYVRYLPMSITVHEESTNSQTGEKTLNLHCINSDMSGEGEHFSKRYSATIDGSEYLIILGMGSQVHEIYQNNVLITDRYNLLGYDLTGEIHKLSIPHLRIQIDSPDFELPFGRHCLRNEHVLKGIAAYIRKRILPDYFETLCFEHKANRVDDTKVPLSNVEDMACGLLLFMSRGPYSWIKFPAFETTDGRKLSFADLQKSVVETGKIYLEDGKNPGVDYSVFESPVLSKKQPVGGLKLLSQHFGDRVINLELNDVILEKPGKSGQQLNAEEKSFQNQIGFQPSIPIVEFKKAQADKRENQGRKPFQKLPSCNSIEDSITNQILEGLNKSSKAARKELEQITWRVNYLVEWDGKTPCNSHKFLYKDDTVILNLNHPEVQKLLILSKTKPELAGHWSLAMCLSESNKILSHLSAESREELIKLDALARILTSHNAQEARNRKQDQDAKKILYSFLDDLDLSAK